MQDDEKLQDDDKNDSCPSCGECRIDYLMWQDDEIHIRCVSCETLYRPPN